MTFDESLLIALCASSFVCFFICALLRTKNTATLTTVILAAVFLAGGSVSDLEFCTVVLASCLVIIAGAEKLLKSVSDS